MRGGKGLGGEGARGAAEREWGWEGSGRWQSAGGVGSCLQILDETGRRALLRLLSPLALPRLLDHLSHKGDERLETLCTHAMRRRAIPCTARTAQTPVANQTHTARTLHARLVEHIELTAISQAPHLTGPPTT